MTTPVKPEPPLPVTWIVLALLPLWLLLVLAIAAPKFVSVLFDNPPSLLGLPLGIVLVGAGVAWAMVGAIAVTVVSSSFVRAAVLALTMLPALFVVIFAPAAVIVAKTLAK
jgi:hypothetical protein